MKSSKGKTPVNGGPAKSRRLGGQGNRKQRERDPVEVYCRVRPLQGDEGESCMTVIKNNLLQITPPECSLAFKSGHHNLTQHTFKQVIDGDSSQKDVFNLIGRPLVEQLIQGKNGLLFAYGITNSGKTYTMTGETGQPGILPRSLDVIFNSIADVQAPKYVFRPDGSNGYDVYSESSAREEQIRNRGKKVSPRMRAETDFSELLRVPEVDKIAGGIDEDSQYAVFVSYIEIYNNYVFDLLDDSPVDPICPKPPKSKNLREDTHHNMYVSGVTEIEVKSTEEAFEALLCGQKRRRVAHTTMNTESSRSHSVFTVRLVQAPLDHTGEQVLQDKSLAIISQLSLVDLAGSERTTRTRCRGDRLREANNINANLMVLRTCMETLRDNQSSGSFRIVPYRDSKLTHLFKNYFDGEGKVCMVVCVNPAAEDYDETIHVMRFAEVTQEVMVDRPEIVKKHIGLAPGRHKANMLYRAALKEATSTQSADGSIRPEPIHPYLLALGVLSIQKYLSEECGLSSVSSLGEFREALENRARVRVQLIEDLNKKCHSFREQLVSQEGQLCTLRLTCEELSSQGRAGEKREKENTKLKSIISSQDETIARLQAELERTHAVLTAKEHELEQSQTQVGELNQERDLLLRTTEMYEVDKRELQDELTYERQKSQQIDQEKHKIKKTMHGFVSQERDKFERLARHMKSQQKDLQTKSAQIAQVKELIRNSPHIASRTPLRKPQTSELPTTPGPKRNCPPIISKGRKRSASENWLEHVPSTTVESNGILQPQIKKKKTVTTPKSKHFKGQDKEMYCLQHQEEDTGGGIKTELYKGKILYTPKGGASVTFTDCETHYHVNPIATPSQNSNRCVIQRPVQSRATTAAATISSRPDISETSSLSSSCELFSGTDISQSISISEEGFKEKVKNKCAVGIEGRPGSTFPALTRQIVNKKEIIHKN